MMNLKKFYLRKRKDESGQSMIIFTFAFLGLLAMLGLALDLGLVYVEKVRLKRSADAASLASVGELPGEEEAARRAIESIIANGYPLDRTDFYVAGCIQDVNNLYLGGANYGLTGNDGTDDLVNLPFSSDYSLSGEPITATIPISTAYFYPYIINDDVDPNIKATFFIDTHSFQERDTSSCDTGETVANATNIGGASKIRVYGIVPVRMNFMQFFGWRYMNVRDFAIAQNSSSLDVAVVLDVTGSMEFDTICYDCWLPCDNSNIDCDGNGYHNTTDNDMGYQEYPNNGIAFPINYEGALMKRFRSAGGENGGEPLPEAVDSANATSADPTVSRRDYIIIEAELYSNNTSEWDPALRRGGNGYWAFQRTRGSGSTVWESFGEYLGSSKLTSFIRYHPYNTTADGNQFNRNFAAEFNANEITLEGVEAESPGLEYDFIPTWTGPTYIFVKGKYYNSGSAGNPRNALFWAVDQWDSFDADPTDPNAINRVVDMAMIQEGGGDGSWDAGNNSFDWFRLNAGTLAQGQKYSLKFWAGSTGYALDRFIITSRSTETNIDSIKNSAATDGSAQRTAADKCNPIFGLYVQPSDCSYDTIYEDVDNLRDSLFGDKQPIRGAKEAIRNFIERLDPKIDQAGFVTFSSNATQQSQLECQKASKVRELKMGTNSQIANYPLKPSIFGEEYDETACYDEAEAVSGTAPIKFMNVYKGIEEAEPGGNTDIADGLRRGLNMLGVTTEPLDPQDNDCNWTWSGTSWQIDGDTPPGNPDSHCARGQAATRVVVLLTDGAPTNGDPGDNDECRKWNDVSANVSPPPYDGFPTSDDMFGCIMYYSEIAGQNGITLYTIGLGVGADPNLLRAAAENSNGQYYFAPSSEQLNFIFDQILGNIYIRLTG